MTPEYFSQLLGSYLFPFLILQLTITAIITMTVFIRTQRAVDLIGANYLLGSLYYTLVRLMTNGVAELIMTITRLPVVDKQKEFYLYPAWAYCLPSAILKIPFSVLDSIVWTSVTYYVIGYSPEITRQVLCLISCTHKIAYFSFTLQSFSYLSLSYGIRFLRQFLLLVTLHMSSTSMCRCLASVFKTDVAATTVGSLVLVLMFLFGGFILPRRKQFLSSLAIRCCTNHKVTHVSWSYIHCSITTTVVEVGILAFSHVIWGNRNNTK